MADSSKPDDPSDIPDPTLEQLLPTMYISDREHCEDKTFPWAQREAIIDFYRNKYKEGLRQERDRKRRETAEGLEALHRLTPPPEPQKPQLGAIIDSLKKPSSAQPELPASRVPEEPKSFHDTIQDVVDEFRVHVGSQLADEIHGNAVPWEPDQNKWSPAALKWFHKQRRAGRLFKDSSEADAAFRASQRPEFKYPGSADGGAGRNQPRPPTEKERADSERFDFMSEQFRREYDEADADQKKVLWEANDGAYKAAQERKKKQRERDRERLEKALDMRQRLKEDPSKAHLLPSDDSTMADLLEWYDKMSKPVRTIPFPGEGGYPQGGAVMSAEPVAAPMQPKSGSSEDEKARALRAWAKKGNQSASPISVDDLYDPSTLLRREPPHRPTWYRALWRDDVKLLLKATPTWIKWAIGLFLFGLTMIQIAEYLFALLSFIASGVFFLLWIASWDGWPNRRGLTAIARAVLFSTVVGGFVAFTLILITIKGPSHWSHLTRFLPRYFHGASTAAPTPSPSPPPLPKNLHDYFAEEGGNCWRETIPQQIKVKDESVTVEAQMCMDFNNKAQHLAFYIPYAHSSTPEVCSQLINNHQATIRDFIKRYQGTMEVGPIEGRKTQVKDLRFTKYVVIFHEAPIPQDKLDRLALQASREGLIVDFHSGEYVLHRMPK